MGVPSRFPLVAHSERRPLLSLFLASGFYGQDCALSLDADGKPELLAGLGYQVRKRRPHVYVYELPPKWNAW